MHVGSFDNVVMHASGKAVVLSLHMQRPHAGRGPQQLVSHA